MRLHRWVIFLVLTALLAGCAPQPAPIPDPAPDTARSVTPSLMPTVVQTNTPLPIAEPTPFSIPTPAPVTQACVAVNSRTSPKTGGILVLKETRDLGPVNVIITSFLLDMDQGEMTPISVPGELIEIVGVSPDRRLLLYEYDSEGDDEYRLAITDSQGKIIMNFDNRVLPESWWDYSNWHGTNLLRVVILNLGKRRVLPRLYNIMTGEYTPLETDWPNAYKEDDLDWGLDERAIDVSSSNGANIVYDPAISRVVYPKKGQVISLTDVETGQELASIQLPQWGRLPRWSDNGEHLVLIASADPKAVLGHDEFFIVSRDGPHFKRLTYLTKQFDKVHISDYAWSPDGKQIAFWLNTEAEDPALEGTQSELAIVDVDTGEITRLCIEGISAPVWDNIVIRHIQPVWSPDGHQIAFAQFDKSKTNSYNVLIVDLDTKTVSRVATNKEPIGWMVKEP